ncbi:signal peptidase II [Arcanobacterium hippocoleae]|uniref:Lipoprotein signal peptidase n=1 Tax=Arcanobacterium hippocoleae TaxID=149017 RepID=A0ABU1T0U4_9ACTO|nr:signal peptidase II [Arcanobacterium hippocoleae]MDR6938994.1 signal peptidase II [Arcanobacterium hippocoleae]
MKISKKSWLISLVIVFLLVALDQFTKQLALIYLAAGQRIDFLGDFLGFKLIFNSGAAFSLGAASTWIFTVFAVIVVCAMPYVMHKMQEVKYQYVLAVIWAGAIGNLLDRLFREPGFGVGHVVDFIRYGTWFIGNVADIALVAGIGIIIVMQFFAEEESAVTDREFVQADPSLQKDAS